MLIFSVYVHFLVPQCLIPHIYLNGGQNQIQHCVCVCVCVYLVISDWWCCIKKQTRNWIQIRGYWIQKRERERETKRGCFFYTFSFFSDNNRIVFSGIEMMQFLSNHSWYIHSIYIYYSIFLILFDALPIYILLICSHFMFQGTITSCRSSVHYMILSADIACIVK